MTAVLRITDDITNINLLSTPGIQLNAWRPTIQTWKNGGVYVDSQLAEESQLIDAKRANATETLDLKITGLTQDEAVRQMQDLFRLLEKAVNYWITDWQNEPVWIERKATCETETEYALIKNYKIADDENPYTQPFINKPDEYPLKDKISLIIERGPWLDAKPGTGNCVALSTERQAETVGNTVEHIINGGFEFYTALPSGGADFAGWNEVGFDSSEIQASAIVHSGAVAAGIYNTFGAGTSLYQEFDAIPGTTYNLSFWWRFDTGGITAGPYYQLIDMSSGKVIDTYIFDPSIDVYQNYTKSIVSPPECKKMRILFYFTPVPADADILLIDDVSVTSVVTDGCENKVYISNFYDTTDITHIFIYDQSGLSFSANKQGSGVVYKMFPDPAGVDDAIYFGVNILGADPYGPFSSLVLDVQVAASGLTIVWEYYNGAGWGNLTIAQDSTNPGTGTLRKTGINPIVWVRPSNWATVNLVGPGITAYWVRAHVTAVAGGAVVPILAAGSVYNIVSPYVEIDDAEIGGDIEALMRGIFTSASDTPLTTVERGRIIMGSRGVERGANFNAFINLDDGGHRPTGISVTLTTGLLATFVNDTTAPVGRAVQYAPTATGALTQELQISFTPSILHHYYGKYRLFLRARSGGTGNPTLITARIRATIGATVFTSETLAMPALSTLGLLDFGVVNIANPIYSAIFPASSLVLYIDLANADAAAPKPTVNLYDLILMPIDEWAADEQNQAGVANGPVFELDSLTYPKISLIGVSKSLSGYVNTALIPIAHGSFRLPANRQLRIWFVSSAYNLLTPNIEITQAVELRAQQRYLGMRGDR